MHGGDEVPRRWLGWRYNRDAKHCCRRSQTRIIRKEVGYVNGGLCGQLPAAFRHVVWCFFCRRACGAAWMWSWLSVG